MRRHFRTVRSVPVPGRSILNPGQHSVRQRVQRFVPVWRGNGGRGWPSVFNVLCGGRKPARERQMTAMEERRMNDTRLAARVIAEVKKVIVGKDEVLIKMLLAILAGGHILLEDIPGVGKTTMALAFSRALGLRYGRMQFTPDVMPSDLTGFSMVNRATGQLEYQPGALLCNLFLADELNRATSRTQSALLEAMEEGQVTVDGVSHPIPQPFLVIATQNPTGASGTQLLPDSQLDRFMLRLTIGYPRPADELELLRRRQQGGEPGNVRQVISHAELSELRTAVDHIFIAEDLLDYIVRLVGATRSHPRILQGASPRAALALASASRAAAFLHGRDYAVPEDIRSIFPDAIAHRLIPVAGGPSESSEAVKEILNLVEAPKIR